MAVLAVALLVAAIVDSRVSLLSAKIIIVLGSLATCFSRTRRIAKLLQTPSIVPLSCTARFGAPIALGATEKRAEFLTRAYTALVSLADSGRPPAAALETIR
jgi:hypothetical protein